MGPGLNDATYLYYFLSISTFEMTQIANFLKTMFCSRGILSLVLESNAWFNCWLNCKIPRNLFASHYFLIIKYLGSWGYANFGTCMAIKNMPVIFFPALYNSCLLLQIFVFGVISFWRVPDKICKFQFHQDSRRTRMKSREGWCISSIFYEFIILSSIQGFLFSIFFETW